MTDVFEKDGQKYLRIGDKAVPFDDYDAAGKPIIKPKIEVREHPDGRRDTIVKIPALQIRSK